jgi:hypothetical protein
MQIRTLAGIGGPGYTMPVTDLACLASGTNNDPAPSHRHRGGKVARRGGQSSAPVPGVTLCRALAQLPPRAASKEFALTHTICREPDRILSVSYLFLLPAFGALAAAAAGICGMVPCRHTDRLDDRRGGGTVVLASSHIPHLRSSREPLRLSRFRLAWGFFIASTARAIRLRRPLGSFPDLPMRQRIRLRGGFL